MNMRHALSVAVAIVASAAGFAQAKTIFVDPTGSSGDFLSLQQALYVAERGDEIVLGPGVYAPVFDVVPGLIAIDVATVEQDDLIIRSSHGPDETIIDGSDRYRGINGKMFGSSLHIEGITFRDCLGAIVASDREIKIRNCRFESCYSDRHPEEPTPNLASCIHVERFWRNGYVDHRFPPSNLTIDQCEFNVNNGWYGAVRCDGNLTLRNSTFSKNTAKFGGAGVLWGQLWYIYDHGHNHMEVHVPHSLEMTVDNCTFVDNQSDWHGGAICAYHGHQPWGAHAEITNSRFEANGARDCGGGLYFYVDDSKYWSSQEVDWISPGAVHTQAGRPRWDRGHYDIHGPEPISSSITVEHCDFLGNTASRGAGGGAFIKTNDAILTDCTFQENRVHGDSWVAKLSRLSDWSEILLDEEDSFLPRGRTWRNIGSWDQGTRHLNRFQPELSSMGGGLYISVHDSTDHDRLHPKSVTANGLLFSQNSARHGGGLAMTLSTSEPTHQYRFDLTDLKFDHNQGMTGAAMFVAGTRDATLEPLFMDLRKIEAIHNVATHAATIQLDAESLVTRINESQVTSNTAPMAAILEHRPIEFDEFDPPGSLDSPPPGPR